MKTAIFAIVFLALCGLSYGQTVVSTSPDPKLTFLDQNGKPMSGGCVFSYAAGTLTPQATYTDSTGTVQNANPIILDSAGRASIWLAGQAYKFGVWSNGGKSGNNCASGVQQFTMDGVSGPIVTNPANGATQTITGSLTVTGNLTAEGTLAGNG